MFKEQLMATLKDAVGYHNSGMSDDESVVKAAAQAGFNQEQTRRLAETYNTTKTICFFKTAEDRTVSFTTCDPDKVVGRLFAEEPRKTAAAGPAFIPDYSCYETGERETKAAEEIVPLRRADIFDRSLDSIVESGYTIINSEKRSADYCAAEAGQVAARYGQLLEKVALDLSQNWHYAGHKAADALAYIRDAFGDRAEALAGDVLARLPDGGRGVSAARGLTDFDIKAAGSAAMLDEAADAKLAWAELKACEAEFRKMAEEHETELLKAAGLEWPVEEEDFFVDGLRSGTKAAADKYERVSLVSRMKGEEDPRTTTVEKLDPLSGVFKMVGGAASDAAKAELSAGLSKVVRGPMEREQKKTTDRLRNFQRQVMLEDLLTTDPILSGVEPTRVAQAYETLVRLSPEVSMNKEVVRAILRASTNAEAVSTYDAKQLAELENEIQKQTTLRGAGKDSNISIRV